MALSALPLSIPVAAQTQPGDEQGCVGDRGDQDAREDMFASKVAVYNDNHLIGATKTTATASFGETNPPCFARSPPWRGSA